MSGIGLQHVRRLPIHHQLTVIQPQSTVAKLRQNGRGVRDAEQRFSRVAEFENLFEAFLLKRLVADRQHFIDDQDFRLQIQRYRKRQLGHSTRIGAQRFVDELPDRKIHDRVE
jgi:hypothetical protein